jgi:hypothetical protein
MVMKLVEVEIDTSDVLDDLSDEALLAEIHDRDLDAPNRPDWDRLYQLLYMRRDEEAMQLVREMVEAQTGRIIP